MWKKYKYKYKGFCEPNHQLIVTNHGNSTLINYNKHICVFTADLIMCAPSAEVFEQGHSTALNCNFKYISNLIEIGPSMRHFSIFWRAPSRFHNPNMRGQTRWERERMEVGETREEKKTAWGEKIPHERKSVTERKQAGTLREIRIKKRFGCGKRGCGKKQTKKKQTHICRKVEQKALKADGLKIEPSKTSWIKGMRLESSL